LVTIKEIEHQLITLSDGVRLSARLWLPDLPSGEQVPAILEYIPYRKRDMVRLRDQKNHPFFARNGYVSIRVDMRGSGDSEGSMRDMYSSAELDDAVEVIEWIAQQPWCNGQVGMMGTSWGATSSLQTASRRPKNLKAVIAVCATNNRFDDDIHHMGGCLLTDTVEWAATLPAILASPPDSDTVGPQWREMWLQRLEQLELPVEHWISHEWRDYYWRWGSVNETPKAINCPVLMIGGWVDRYSNTIMNFLNDAHAQCWGIVGPWGHHYPDQANPAPGINFQQEALRWWDHWLKGVENQVNEEPRLRVWIQEYVQPENVISSRPGRWASETNWPSADITRQTLYFEPSRLVDCKPQTELNIQVPWSLSVGNAAGDTGYFGRVGGLPLNQTIDDEHSLVFQTERLEEPMEILGAVSLKVELTAMPRNAMLVARLNDVHPDGSVARVCYVIKNLALDHKGEKAEITDSKIPLHIELDFPHTAYQFAIDHQIRIAISSSYWPIVWPSPTRTRLTLHLTQMELCLPVRDPASQDAEINFITPENTVETVTHKVISAPPLKRWTDISKTSREQFICWQQPWHRIFHTDINLQFGFATEAQHKINLDDPTSAATKFKHELSFCRDERQIQILSSVELRCSETHFLLRGKLIVLEDEEVIFQREWEPSLLRTCS
jgi:putative CocE/NonD family hydrolase